MPTIKIVDLNDHPHLISTVIDWIQKEWPKEETVNRSVIEHRLCGQLIPNHLPQALIALDGQVPVGYVSLIQFETDECKGKLFWVDGLLVVPMNRGSGLGSRLLQAASERAVLLGLPYLCAYTEEVSLYSRNGWTPLPSMEPRQPGPVVMEKLLR